ncbi:hypothetical protein [Agriterribacter sp.]|uniref:hypothetical protein n=1 Tax=Agriterribacter sp. TaxID=2821509 RepID=UPI002BAFE01A|nr:hypothetical protein [Agriterribacter sp.]HTN08784.1 hypothetical protein [Agriterribacter sp.]
METIFDYDPSPEELSGMQMTYKTLDTHKYMEDLEQRATLFDTSIDYERISDLQELARIRRNDAAFSKFTRMLEQDMGDIHDRLFNE